MGEGAVEFGEGELGISGCLEVGLDYGGGVMIELGGGDDVGEDCGVDPDLRLEALGQLCEEFSIVFGD